MRTAPWLTLLSSSLADASLVNFLAVMLGGMISLPAVRNFCLYAGTAIFFSYAFQVRRDVRGKVTQSQNGGGHGKVCPHERLSTRLRIDGQGLARSDAPSALLRKSCSWS